MRAASAASRDAGRAIVAANIDAQNYLEVGEEFFALADLLRDNSALVRALTSPSHPGEAKQQLAREVFANISAPVRDTVTEIAALRWSEADDLVAACEDLGVEALLLGAKAAGVLAQIEQEVFQLAEFLGKHREVRNNLADSLRADRAQRVALAQHLFAERVHPATMKLMVRIVQTVKHGRLHSALYRVSERAAELMATQMVVVEVASPLHPDQVERMRQVLTRRYQSDITLNVRIVPELIGGARIHIGADVIEGSLATALDKTRRSLVGSAR